MPITPFHLGPGVLFKALGGKRISWTAFALANGLVDLEPIFLFLTTGIPDHRFFHTFPGITIVGLLAFWPGIYLCQWWLSTWNRCLSPSQNHWLGVSLNVSPSSVLIGALLGSWSHLILDSVMHWTMQPFWPFSHINPLKGQFTVEALHLGCLVTGGVGLIVITFQRIIKITSTKNIH